MLTCPSENFTLINNITTTNRVSRLVVDLAPFVHDVLDVIVQVRICNLFGHLVR